MEKIRSVVDEMYDKLERVAKDSYINDYMMETVAKETLEKLVKQGELNKEIAYDYISELVRSTESKLEDNGYEVIWEVDRLGNRIDFVYYKNIKSLEKWVRDLEVFTDGRFENYEDREKQINEMIAELK